MKTLEVSGSQAFAAMCPCRSQKTVHTLLPRLTVFTNYFQQ